MIPGSHNDERSVLAQMRDQIALTPLPGTHQRLSPSLLTARPRVLAGASVSAGILATTAVLAFAGASSPPAFAVTTTAEGIVTITLNSLSAVADLNAKLAAAGVHVRVAAVQPGCNAPVQLAGSTAPPATLEATPGAGASTIELSSTTDPNTDAPDPTNVPDGQILVLAASPSGLQTVGQITQTTPPACVAPGA